MTIAAMRQNGFYAERVALFTGALPLGDVQLK